MGIFDFFKKSDTQSKNIAKDRLKLVLIHDRAMLPSGVLEDMKDDIIAAISKYVDIDRNSLNIEVAQSPENKRRTTLIANIPLIIKKLKKNNKNIMINKKWQNRKRQNLERTLFSVFFLPIF